MQPIRILEEGCSVLVPIWMKTVANCTYFEGLLFYQYYEKITQYH
jgi:hypothetical protein